MRFASKLRFAILVYTLVPWVFSFQTAVAQSVSLSLSTSSPGSQTVTITGTQTIGDLSSPVDITATNNTGAPLTIYANYYVFSSSWPAGNGNFVQYDGDAMARTWALSSSTNTCITSVPSTLASVTLASGASCHVYGHLVPTSTSSTGHIIFKMGDGTLLGTVTLNATTTPPAAASPAMPDGIASDGTGTVMDTTWPSTTGYPVTSVSANLQAALDAATCGSVLRLTGTFSLNLMLRNKGCPGNQPIIIESSDCNATGTCTNLPAQGTRVAKTQTTYMAKIQTPNSNPAILMECGAGPYRLVGLEITQQNPSPNFYQQSLVVQIPAIGSNCIGSIMPHDIVLDRYYIHTYTGDSPEFTGNVLTLCSQKNTSDPTSKGGTAALDGILWSDGGSNELQAISSTCNQSGHYKFINNEVVHSGENVFFGGGDGPYIGIPPSDIELRGNYVHKPPTWNENCWGGWSANGGVNPCGSTTWDFGNSPVTGLADKGTWAAGTYSAGDVVYYGPTTCHYYVSQVNSNTATPGTDRTKWFCSYRQVKNLFELKKAHNTLSRGNIYENNWVGAQDGSDILLECADQAGSDLQACVRDLTFDYNIVRNGAFGLNGVSSSYAYPSEAMQRVRFSNNLIYGINKATTGAVQSQHMNNLGPGATQTANTHNQISGWNFFMDHNTWISSTTGCNAIYVYSSSTLVKAQINFHMTGNLWDPKCTYGFMSNGVTGDNGIAIAFGNTTLPKNLIVGADDSTYSSTNWVRPFPANDAAVRFSNTANNDYRLCTGVGVPDSSCPGASPYHNAAPDGLDYGADIATINTLTANVVSGGGSPIPPPTTPNPFKGKGVKCKGCKVK